MSAPDEIEPLERRYRALLWLLPADHRAARGEELLGLLLDLDAGRARPSARQAAGVVGLALRLRLARTASLLLAAFLVATTTAMFAMFYQIVTGHIVLVAAVGSPVRNAALALLIPCVFRLAAVVAWILGRRRTALAVLAALLAFELAVFGPVGRARIDLVFIAVLGLAAALRLPAPRQRVALLAAIPLAMVLWMAMAELNILSNRGILFVTAVVALVGAAAGRLSHRRASRRTTPATG